MKIYFVTSARTLGILTCFRIFRTAVNLPCSLWRGYYLVFQQMAEQMLKFWNRYAITQCSELSCGSRLKCSVVFHGTTNLAFMLCHMYEHMYRTYIEPLAPNIGYTCHTVWCSTHWTSCIRVDSHLMAFLCSCHLNSILLHIVPCI